MLQPQTHHISFIFLLEERDDSIRANATGIASFYSEVTVDTKWNSPGISDDPILFWSFSLANDGYGMIEWFFGTISEWFAILCSKIGHFSGIDGNHGGYSVTQTKLILNSLTIFPRQPPKAINFILPNLRVIDNFLPTRIRMPTLRSIRICILFYKSNFNSILEPFSDITLTTTINKIIFWWTINKLLFW